MLVPLLIDQFLDDLPAGRAEEPVLLIEHAEVGILGVGVGKFIFDAQS